jgi:hypothetical protein
MLYSEEDLLLFSGFKFTLLTRIIRRRLEVAVPSRVYYEGEESVFQIRTDKTKSNPHVRSK